MRTLLVGDEPRDIVFAGPGTTRARSSPPRTAARTPAGDPQLTTPGVGRADVWVFDADHLGATLGGTPLTIVTLFTDTPRALAVTPDGSRRLRRRLPLRQPHHRDRRAAGPNGGNGGLPPSDHRRRRASRRPQTGLIVKHRVDRGQPAHWVDEVGRRWDDDVKFSLPDKDVFVIDATANPAGRQARRLRSPASAPSSSTWPSTR